MRDPSLKPFTFYWRDGLRKVLYGTDAADAMTKAGYGAGAIAALDMWAYGDDKEYDWNATTRKWEPVCP